MAALARAMGESLKYSCFFPGLGDVAFLTRHFLMTSRQRKRCARVIESRSGSPRFRLVAPATLVPFLPAMRVLMAGYAFAMQTEEGAIHIFQFDLATGGGRNVFGSVALFASERLVFAFERKPGLRSVIECLAIEPY